MMANSRAEYDVDAEVFDAVSAESSCVDIELLLADMAISKQL
jgi:hypothetical protein